jgi:hypothetical protein
MSVTEFGSRVDNWMQESRAYILGVSASVSSYIRRKLVFNTPLGRLMAPNSSAQTVFSAAETYVKMSKASIGYIRKIVAPSFDIVNCSFRYEHRALLYFIYFFWR